LANVARCLVKNFHKINSIGHKPTGLNKHRIWINGRDLAGVVEAIGADVSGFRNGDEVYGMTGGVGGIQGSLAESPSMPPCLRPSLPA
jgi:NADPH:quinone reductase-like Zn-dependent oxidoreductase